MIQEYLQEIGLSKNEAKIYQMLLKSGPSFVGRISSKTKIHRRNVYDSIEKLKEKGFVSWTIKNNRKYFEAVNPKRILDIFEEKKEKIKSIIPLLIKRQRLLDTENIRVYTGNEGRKIIFEDKLRDKGEQLVLGAHKPSKIRSRYRRIYHKRRIAKKISLKMLFPLNKIETAKEFSKLKYVKVRILPKILSNSPITINIYGDKVAFLAGSEKQSPLSILIEDKNLSEDFRNYFYTIWDISKKLSRK